ncbi:hypothetical protein GW17_00024971 [Ensete ventricosum]|nr:hypothetical protein GW17_00024971 [Ensete ventricosum]
MSCSTCRSIIEKLGQERLSKIKIVGKEEVKESLYGQLVLGKGVSSSLEELLAKEVQKAGEKLNMDLPLDLIFHINHSLLFSCVMNCRCAVCYFSATARAEFRSAKAVMDAFGGADLTISKLRRKNWA